MVSQTRPEWIRSAPSWLRPTLQRHVDLLSPNHTLQWRRLIHVRPFEDYADLEDFILAPTTAMSLRARAILRIMMPRVDFDPFYSINERMWTHEVAPETTFLGYAPTWITRDKETQVPLDLVVSLLSAVRSYLHNQQSNTSTLHRYLNQYCLFLLQAVHGDELVSRVIHGFYYWGSGTPNLESVLAHPGINPGHKAKLDDYLRGLIKVYQDRPDIFNRQTAAKLRQIYQETIEAICQHQPPLYPQDLLLEQITFLSQSSKP